MTPGTRSALYAGEVVHLRLRPRRHQLRYRVVYLLLDLDEAERQEHSPRLFSYNGSNVFSVNDRDHGNGSAASLRDQVQRHLRDAGIEAGGPIRLLTMPRVLGYVFNPLSVYFCHRVDGSLAAILYEVNNTFGERHNYLVPVAAGCRGVVRQHSRKSFYVSPFLDTDMTYAFAVVPPAHRVAVSVTGHDGDGPLIVARLAAVRRPFTDAALARTLLLYPLLTLKVTAAIHWEALLLWLKGVRLQHRPPPPERDVTMGHETAPYSVARKDESSCP